MVVHVFHSNTLGVEGGESRSQCSQIHRQLKASLGDVRPCFKKTKQEVGEIAQGGRCIAPGLRT